MDESVVTALTALTLGDVATARRAVAGGGSLVATALAEHLEGPDGGSVYDRPAAFEAFIRGGGNVPLYAAVGEALGELYDRSRPAGLLDVGCGDGEALVAALGASRHRPARLDLVEPSPALLSAVVERLSAGGPGVDGPELRTWPSTAQSFVADLGDPGTRGPARSWPLAQSTFALHAIPHDERTTVLTALRPRVGLLALVEFDVPTAPTGSPEHLRFLARTYEQGLAEYGDDRDLVAQGFLMPVLTGQLRPGAVRATWEQPVAAWVSQVETAGYRDVSARVLLDYWSSPAFLLTAHGDG